MDYAEKEFKKVEMKKVKSSPELAPYETFYGVRGHFF